MKKHTLMIIAAVNGLAATGLAASGAHAFKMDEKGTSFFGQAGDFHFYHTFALVACAFLVHLGQERTASRSAIFFMVGLAGFSGSLYWRAIMGPGSLGGFHWITPLGGLALMAGWVTLIFAAFASRKENAP
ncbi:MAG: hypothetical protein COB37_09295 [Kordiimonadales bacterium]|nr:MAG: hypothetical protein COB37_09295 [Kordiimonadales bacterium]